MKLETVTLYRVRGGRNWHVASPDELRYTIAPLAKPPHDYYEVDSSFRRPSGEQLEALHEQAKEAYLTAYSEAYESCDGDLDFAFDEAMSAVLSALGLLDGPEGAGQLDVAASASSGEANPATARSLEPEYRNSDSNDTTGLLDGGSP